MVTYLQVFLHGLLPPSTLRSVCLLLTLGQFVKGLISIVTGVLVHFSLLHKQESVYGMSLLTYSLF